MNKKEKKVVFTIIGIMVAILLVVIIVKNVNKEGKLENVGKENTQISQNVEKYTTNLEDGTKINNSNNFNQTKKYKNIEISNIQFTYKDGNSVLLADVRNTSNVAYESEIVKMTIVDENNKVIDELEPIMPKMEPGETKQLNVIISGADSVNAKDFKIESK